MLNGKLAVTGKLPFTPAGLNICNITCHLLHFTASQRTLQVITTQDITNTNTTLPQIAQFWRIVCPNWPSMQFDLDLVRHGTELPGEQSWAVGIVGQAGKVPHEVIGKVQMALAAGAAVT